jgi:hypothetical protein
VDIDKSGGYNATFRTDHSVSLERISGQSDNAAILNTHIQHLIGVCFGVDHAATNNGEI